MPILLIVVTCVIAVFGVLNSNYGFRTDSIQIKYEDLLPSYKKQVTKRSEMFLLRERVRGCSFSLLFSKYFLSLGKILELVPNYGEGTI